MYENGLGKTSTPTSVRVGNGLRSNGGFNMVSYVGESLLVKKTAAVLLLLLGIVLIVIGMHDDSWSVASLGALSLLGGVFLLVLKIVARNQSNQP
jgi:membrane-bound ClpP family serine protease